MARQQKLIHLHGNSDFNQSTVTIDKGEIAVEHGTGAANVKLWTLDENNAKVAFMSSAAVAAAIAAEAEIARAAEKANAAAIATLNGDTGTTGSVDQKVSAAITALDEDLQGQIDALSNKVGTTDVAAQIEAAVKVEADRAKDAEKVNADAIDVIEGDYLKGADKTELNNLITGLTETVNTNEADIEAKMSAEIERATKAEGDLQDAIDAIEGDYLKGADKTALEEQIDDKVAQSDYDAKMTALDQADETNAKAITAHTSNGNIHVTAQEKTDWQAATDAINAFMDAENVGTEVVDTLKEIQDYINTDGAAADKMTKDIAANAAAIATLNGDTGTTGSVDQKVSAAITALNEDLQGQIDDKVAQSDYDTKMTALDQADTNNATAIANEKKRAEEAEEILQNAIDAIAGEDGGSLADTLQAAMDYTDGVLGGNFTTGNTVAAAIAANADAIDAIEKEYLKSSDKTALEEQIDDKVAQSDYDTKMTALDQADTNNATAIAEAEGRIKNLEDADYVKSVSVQTTWDNKITVTKAEGAVTLNLENMVIDCGTY